MFSILEQTGKDLSWIDQDKYVLADTPELAREFIQECLDAKGPIGWDTETTGLSIFVDKIVGFSLSPEEGRACYVPLRHQGDQNVEYNSIKDIYEELLTTKEIIAHQSTFDWIRALVEWGVDVNVIYDTLIETWILDSDKGPKSFRKKLSLEKIVLDLFNMETLVLSDVTQHGSNNFALVPTDDALWYAGPDADFARRVHMTLFPKIKSLGLEVVYKIEMGVVKPVSEMFKTGLGVDQEFLSKIDIDTELSSIEDELARLTGVSVNLQSPDQVANLLFEKLKLPRIKKDSTDDSVLEKLEARNPAVSLIREHRDWAKLKTGFIDKLGEATAEDGRLHLEYCQSGTRSGRFSSFGGIGRGGAKIKINGQTWPKGKKINVRESLKPEDGSIWLSMDYSQIEYKVVAYDAQQPELIEAIKDGVDFHEATASLFLGVPLNQVTEELRGRGKTLNFGVVYGMTPGGLAARLGVPFQEGKRLIDKYYERLGQVQRLINETKKFILKNGFVKTKFGRIRWFKDIKQQKERRRDALLGAGWNSRIQGTAADLNKIGLKKVYLASKSLPVKLMSTVHDEVNAAVSLSVSPKEVLPPLLEAMTLREGLFPGWLGFDADLSLGTSYGTLLSVPKELIDKFEKWDDLLEESRKLKEEKDKARADKKTSKQSFDVSYVPTGLQVQAVDRVKPSVKISLKETVSVKDSIASLKEIVSYNHGLYKVYIEMDDGNEFLVSGLSVNPTPQFARELGDKGMTLTLFSAETVKFDSNSLNF